MKVGILGGGQLARMMALAGYPLGLEFVVLDPAEDACARHLADHIVADYDDEDALQALAEASDYVTFDFENVPAASLALLVEQVHVSPGAKVLGIAQDRLLEKQLASDLGIATAPYKTADQAEQLVAAVTALGAPVIAKTRRFGYDGKGQRTLKSAESAAKVWTELGEVPLIIEKRINFDREVSMIGVRSKLGEVAVYPLTENRHRQGILATSLAPAHGDQVAVEAKRIIEAFLDRLDYVGVLAIEFFDCDGELLFNEMAPRVHNSGHWTIDGADCSQFENHLRAVLGWPLGSTRARGASAMLNWIGAMPDPALALSYPNAHWHNYGKAARPGRKVGHTTLVANNLTELQTNLGRFALALGEQLKASGINAFLS